MSMSFFKPTRKFWIGLIALAAIISAISYYLFILVADRESTVIQEKFRRTRQLAENVLLKKRGKEKEFTFKVETEVNQKKSRYLKTRSILLREKSPSRFFDRRLSNPDTLYLPVNIKDDEDARKGSITFCTQHLGDFVSNTFPTGSEFFIIRLFKTTQLVRQPDDVAKTEYINCQMVIHGDQWKLQSPNYGVIAYQTMPNRIHLREIDSLLFEDHGLLSQRPVSTELNGTRYRIFPHRIQFEQDEDWIICSLLKEQELVAKSREVGLWTVVIGALLVLLTLLSFPLLKLMIMSSIERLKILNVWFAGFGVAVGASVITLIYLAFTHYKNSVHNLDHRLDAIGDGVELRLKNEINNVLSQLHDLQSDSLLRKSLFKRIGTEKDAVIQKTVVPKINDSTRWRKKLSSVNYFNEAGWIGKNGRDVVKLATHKINFFEAQFDLNQRHYFTRALKGKTWSFKPALPFALESIQSWDTGEPEAGIGVPLTKQAKDTLAAVIIMSTKLYSVMNVQLPPGYSFAIIDQSGNVWFHSTIERNLQENLFDETGKNAQLMAGVAGRLQVRAMADYHGKYHQLRVKPLPGTDLSIVTLYNREYFRAPIVLTLGFAIALTCLLFLISGIHFLLLFVASYRPTRLNIKRFYLFWLRPRHDRHITVPGTWKPSLKYQRSLVFQAILISSLLVLYWVTSERWAAGCFLLAPVYVLTFHFFLYRREYIRNQFQVEMQNSDSKLLRHLFFIFSVTLATLINLVIFRYIDRTGTALIMLVQLFWIGWARVIYSDSMPEINLGSWINKRLYLLSLFVWVVTCSMLPVAYFYKLGFHQQNQNWQKYLQISAFKQQQQREESLTDELNEKGLTKGPEVSKVIDQGDYTDVTGELRKGDLSDTIYPDTRKHNNQPKRVSIKDQASLNFAEVLFEFGPVSRGVEDEVRRTVYEYAHDTAWHWQNKKQQTVLWANNKSIFTSAAIPYVPFLMKEKLSGLLVLISGALIAAVLFLIWRINTYLVKHIFGKGLLEQRDVQGYLTDVDIKQPKLRLFVVGLPFSGKSKQYGRPPTDRFEEVDVRKATVLTNNEKSLWLNHFEYGITNHKLNESKLKLLNEISADETKSIVIFSAIQPTAILDFYEKLVKDSGAAMEKGNCECAQALRKDWFIYKQALRHWKNILAAFQIVYQPYRADSSFQAAHPLLWDELNHNDFLRSLQFPVTSYNLNKREDQEEAILRIGSMAETHYHAIWNSLSNEEKFLLYDLAKDRFVNLRNRKVINQLLSKGLIRYRDSLQIMNSSFNNFITVAVGYDEEMKMQQELSRKGTWSTVQLVLVFSLVGIVSFLALAQQDLMPSFNLWIGAVSGLVAMLVNFSGLIKSQKT